MNGLYLLALTLVLTLAQTKAEGYNVNAVCGLVKDGTKLGSLESCQTFYVCKNRKAVQQSCASSESFDKNTETCRPSSQVKCYWGNKTPCAGQTDKVFVPVAGSCRGWIYCENGKELGRGACNPGLIFVNGECKYGKCEDNVNGQESNANFHSICQVMPNNKFFGSTTDCKQWQVCRNEELDGGSCNNDMVYDPPTGMCVYESVGTCDYATGQVIQPDEEKGGDCLVFEEGVKRASDSKCGNYFVCIKQKWVRRQCPDNKYWDVKLGECNSRNAAVTSESCDRCQYAKTQFVNAVDGTDCRKYLVCNNGIRKGKGGICEEGHYFDESAQACIKSDPSKYAQKHGACQGRDEINECLGKCYSSPDTCGVIDGVCKACTTDCNNNYCTEGKKCTDPTKCVSDPSSCTDCPSGVDTSGVTPVCKS